MEIKKRILPVLLLLLLIPFLCFSQSEENDDGYTGQYLGEDGEWHTVPLRGEGELSASERAQLLVEEEFEKHLEEEGSFYILSDEEDNQFIIQEFKWEPSEYVYMYHFTVERKNENGEFVPYDEQDVEENYADCQLIAGEYRYKIGLYNFLGVIELETEWYPVNVKKAIKPSIKSVSPDYMYIDVGSECILTVKGEDLSESASFKLMNLETGSILPAVVVDKDIAKSVFKIQVGGIDLAAGDYAVTARNEGGLTYSFSSVQFVHSRPIDFCFSLRRSWSCAWNTEIIPDSWFWNDHTTNTSIIGLIWQDDIDDLLGGAVGTVREFLDKSAVEARFSVIPFKKNAGFFGFGLDCTLYMAANQVNLYNTNYDIYGYLHTLRLDFIYEHTLGTHFIFDAHVGAGATAAVILLEYNSGTVDDMLYGGLCLAGGVSLQWYPGRYVYFEIGCDYDYHLFNGIKVDYLNPGASFGVRF